MSKSDALLIQLPQPCNILRILKLLLLTDKSYNSHNVPSIQHTVNSSHIGTVSLMSENHKQNSVHVQCIGDGGRNLRDMYLKNLDK